MIKTHPDPTKALNSDTAINQNQTDISIVFPKYFLELLYAIHQLGLWNITESI